MPVNTDTPYVEKVATAHVEERLGHGAADDAKHASDNEHKATFWETFKKYRAAVFWSCIISMTIVMEGYDTILINNFWPYPTFQKKYGHYYGPKDGWEVPAHWQAGLGQSSTVGTIIGGFINGWAIPKYGYKWTVVVALFFMNAFIFIVFFAPDDGTLLGGELLCGITWGVFATTGPAYASEVCPLALRGYLTVYVNLCWAIGQFIASGVLKGLLNNTTQWGYRIPFAIQWVWPVPLMIIIIFAPESPWYYVRRDRLEDATKMIKRLGSVTDQEASGTLALMVHTVKIENEVTAGSSYLDCFRGVDLRRTEIACIAFAGQILSGSTFAYSPTYFFTQAGIDDSDSYALGLGATGFAFVGTILSWFLLARLGRRTIYLGGQIICACILIIIGIIAATHNSGGGLWAQAAFALCWLFCYSLTIGPITYSIIAEISAVRLRAQTVVLSRVTYQVVNIISGILVPYQLQAWNWQGRTGFFWAGSSALVAIWAYFRLPEPKDRTYEELDILFAKRIPARQFSKTEVDAYAEAELVTDRDISERQEQKP